MERPLISYVVTTYNIEKFVEESVQCAFNQTYTPLEIVLSDDASTDNTFAIMKRMVDEYKGPHKIVLNCNETNLGIAKHMNKAYLELATGEIIVAAHGDDISKPERTEESYEFLKIHPNMTAISFGIEAIDEHGENIQQHSAMVDRIQIYDFKKGGNIPAPSRCFYKKVMQVFGPLNDDCPTEDELISFRALILGENAFLPETMVKYRKHSGSSSNPENFENFPLEKILKQQNDDMIKAVEKGLITEEMRRKTYQRLEGLMLVRKKYRQYFSSKSLVDMLKLVLYKRVPIRTKLHYVREHIRYCMFRNRQEG